MTKKIKKISKKVLKQAEKIIEELNEKQKAFCRFYIVDWNGTKAYQSVYDCDYNSARVLASNLLSNINIKAYIDKIKNENEKNAGISKLKVIQEHMKLAFSSIAHLHDTWITRKKFAKLTDEQKCCIQEISTSIKKIAFNDDIQEVEYVKLKLYSKQDSLKELSKLLGYDEPVKNEHLIKRTIIKWGDTEITI